MKLLCLYRSSKGIWRYDVERNGRVRWSSLHTRDEHVARGKYQQIKTQIEARLSDVSGSPVSGSGQI